jgi:hypothetical protein
VPKQPQSVRLQRDRIHGLGGGPAVLVEVTACLVEELALERDMALVNEVHLAHVGDVGDAARIRGRDDARDDALKQRQMSDKRTL